MALDQSAHTERSQAGTHANIDLFSADHLPPTGKVLLISWSAWYRQAAVVCQADPVGLSSAEVTAVRGVKMVVMAGKIEFLWSTAQ